MTDLLIIRRCAEAMKDESAAALEFLEEGHRGGYEPLHDDAQAMALVKKFRLQILEWRGDADWCVRYSDSNQSFNDDLNRAICECVAKMGEAK